MTIFQLFLYSCISMNGFDGELLSKQCRWQPDRYYSQIEKCDAKGVAVFGNRVFSDTYEDRKIEKHKCTPIGVE